MLSLPLVHRELLVAARRPAVFRTRVGLAAFMVVAALLFLLFSGAVGQSAEAGQAFFQFCSTMLMLVSGAIGIVLGSDAICGERREGTLHLLRLAHVSGVEVVLGKLTGGMVQGGAILLAMAPAISISPVLGGVRLAEVWLTLLAAGVHLLVSLAVSLAVSAWATSAGRSMVVAASLVVGWGLAGLVATLASGSESAWILSPAGTFFLARHEATRANPSAFWLCAGLATAASAVALLVAARGMREEPGTSSPRLLRLPISLRRASVLSRSLLERGPVMALLLRESGTAAVAWVAAAAHTLSLMAAPSISGAGSWSAASMLVTIPQLLLLSAIAWQTAHRLSEDRRAGLWELILSTPLTEAEIRRDLWAALRRRFMPPALAMTVSSLVIPAVVSQDIGISLIQLFFAGGLVLAIWATAAMGLWFGLTEVRPAWAFLKTLLGVGVMGVAQTTCCPFVVPPLVVAWAHYRLNRPLRPMLSRPAGNS
jgi:ABC-type transport system involved in multi-copper enzyme maturation permease subunit